MFCENFVYRTITLGYKAFHSLEKFTTSIEDGFGAGVIVNGCVTKADLSDYLLFLKDAYVNEGDARQFLAASHTGYMGSDYWFLSPEVNFVLRLTNRI